MGVAAAILTLFFTPLAGITQEPYVSPNAPRDDPPSIQNFEERDEFLKAGEDANC